MMTDAADPSLIDRAAAMRDRRGRILIGGAIGHFIEWYDWGIYGFLAGVFASQMFPADDATASLIASFSAFAIGFIGRPIGAFVLSPLADKYGRRTLLSLSIILAGLGSLVIAICPTYSQIGLAAPLIIIMARLVQGFSAGGEFQIAITFLNEHAGARHRALTASPQQLSIGLAVLVATAVSSLTTAALSPRDLTTWGWRLPFLLGALLSLFGFYLRSGIPETPAYERMRASAERRMGSIIASIRQFPKEAFIVFVVQLSGVQYYIWLIFLPTYANLVGHLDRASGFAGSILASIAYCIGVPIFAAISDRIGRKPFLIAAAACFLVFTYPLLSLLTAQSLGFATYAFVAVVGAIFVSLNNAVLGTVFAELFPTRIRTSGIGIPYAICAAIFGGTAPAAAAWLQGAGGPLYISSYIMTICVVTIATHVSLTPETRGRSLDQ